MKGKKILIVEDDKMLCTIFEMFIKDMQHNLLGIFQDARSAIDFCELNKPDIVLMDIHLPGEFDGIEAARVIQERYDIPVIFLSSDNEEDTLQSAIKINSYGFLLKPVFRTTLATAIEMAYYKHRQELDLKVREKHYESFKDVTTDPVLIITEGKVEFINEQALSVFEIPYVEYILDLPISGFVIENETEKFTEMIDYFLTKNIRIEYFKTKFKTLNDNVVEMAIVGSVVMFNNKKSVQLVLKDPNKK